MRYLITVMGLAALLAAGPAAFAQTSSTKPAAKPAAAKPAAAKSSASSSIHSAQGVVKSVDASSMVITRPGKKGGELTFKLDSSTERDGTLAAGANVSVRYHVDGGTNVATAVKATPAKGHASKG